MRRNIPILAILGALRGIANYTSATPTPIVPAKQHLHSLESVLWFVVPHSGEWLMRIARLDGVVWQFGVFSIIIGPFVHESITIAFWY